MGLLPATPTWDFSSKQVVSFLITLTLIPFGSLDIMDSDHGTHPQETQQWAPRYNMLWKLHPGPPRPGLASPSVRTASSQRLSFSHFQANGPPDGLNSYPSTLSCFILTCWAFIPHIPIIIHPPKFHLGSSLTILKLSPPKPHPFYFIL